MGEGESVDVGAGDGMKQWGNDFVAFGRMEHKKSRRHAADACNRTLYANFLKALT